MKNRLLNIFLRGFSMSSRFLLFVVIAKLLTTSELGTFGLLASGISFFVLFVGADYYTYSNRELLGVSNDKYSQIITNQMYAYIPLYILTLPVLYIMFQMNILPWKYFDIFLILSIAEHMAQEQNRLLNTMQKQLSASIVLFLRTGLWILVVLPIMYFVESTRSIDTLLYGWLFGTITAVSVASIIIKKEIKDLQFLTPDKQWIIKGYKIGFLFLIGSLAFKALSTIDRFWLEKIAETSMVGVYIFYFSLLVGVIAFIHAGLIVFISPKIIKAYKNRNYVEFHKLMRRFFIELIIALLFMLTLMVILVPYVIEWINKLEYLKYYNVFYILMSVSVMMTITNHPHTYLYASDRDKFILYSNISSLVIFIISLVTFKNYFGSIAGIYQVSLSVLISYGYLLVVKYIGYFYYTRRINEKNINIYK